MTNLKFETKEKAGDDHEMHIELKVSGNTLEVKDVLRAWLK